jgi:hypothetical protein
VAEVYFATAAALDREPLVTPDLVLNGNIYRQITRVLLEDDHDFPLLAEVWQALAPAAPPAARSALRHATPPAALSALRRATPAAQVPVDNSVAVLYAIVCGDVAWWRDVDRYARHVAVDRRLFPITAGMPANVWPCVFWPRRPLEPPVAVTGKGPRNVLIMQNLRDPTTGWAGAFALRRALDRRATMVTQDAGGHGVYGIRSGPCAADIANRFLTIGALPDRDRYCPGPSPDDVAVTSTARPTRSGPFAVR